MVNSRGQLVQAVSIPFACEGARQQTWPNSLCSQPRHVSLNTLATTSIPTHPVLQLLLKEVVIMHCQNPNTDRVATVGGVPLAVTVYSSGQEDQIPLRLSQEPCDVVESSGATFGRANIAAAAALACKNVK